MTDDLEDRLRRHLAQRAEAVHAEPDATAFVDRSADRSHRPARRIAVAAAAVLAVLAALAGVLAGVDLAGAGTTASAPTTTRPADRAGADLAPAAGGPGVSGSSAIAVAAADTHLFTRMNSSGVTIRAYSAGSGTTGGCPTTVTCSPPVVVPGSPPTTVTCPTGTICAEPVIAPHATTGPVGTGTTGTSSSGSTSSGAGVTGSGSGTATSGSGTTSTTASCGQLVIELSTDQAVGTGSTVLPMTTPAAGTLEVLGTGSFGLAEGAPVSWVAVWVGAGIGSVQLTVNGTAEDAMAPQGGLAVLAEPGASGLAGTSVVGLGPDGATVATAPTQSATLPDGSVGCAVTTPTTPTTPTNPTNPTNPTTTLPPTTTTTTTPGVAVPGPNQPAPASRAGTGASANG